MPNHKDKLLTIKEVAEFLRVSERSVIRYIEAGRLRAIKVGYWRVSEKALQDFMRRSSNSNNNKKR